MFLIALGQPDKHSNDAKPSGLLIVHLLFGALILRFLRKRQKILIHIFWKSKATRWRGAKSLDAHAGFA